MANVFKITLLALIAGIILNSCVTTNTTSFTDPEFKGEQYDKIVVYADIPDLESRKKMESKITMKLREAGLDAYNGTDMFPPTREWSDESIQAELIRQQINGYLLLQWTDSQVSEEFSPGESHTETYEETEKRGGKLVKVQKTKSYNTGPSVEKKFHSSFRAELIDVESLKTAWVATSNSESDEFLGNEFDMIFDSYAKDIVKKLTEDGHIQVK